MTEVQIIGVRPGKIVAMCRHLGGYGAKELGKMSDDES